ncbi:MAG: UvrD-helicase domain-containing protein, partial [Lachnospiraceae bacterium]|nr:UvrD-helicase domain-containing protein [Lachnospiraceae bacterium]
MKVPNSAQKKAIMHLSGPAVVTAGPGSGKTHVIVSRILYLIENHIPPDNILVITYTKAAAAEMKERYEKSRQSSDVPRGVHFGTFHSICYNILRQSGAACASSLIKESDKRKLLQIILANHGLFEKAGYDGVTGLENLISRMKNLELEHLKNTAESGCFALFTDDECALLKRDYDRHLREQGLIDFEDMIGECIRLLSGSPGLLNKYRRLFWYILADEFQDINPPQYKLLKLLAAPSDNLFVVGDDDQSIYG